ncbi:hypothetical protein Pint_15789 [Pistacia integerrima]|uniref:Uncharacterized protein n=1 Tax=Pistacia integerrima TaxID=434235 RepID=A0ACC0ZD55_9ROSI|nr:hypothetical protein Pint_15789 [Pistacia integerrima]
MQLKEELTLIKKGNQPIQDYLHTVKALADEISLIDHPISQDNLTLYILNGLGIDFHEIAAPIHARERPLQFEELHDLLVGHTAYLRRLETTFQQLVASANYSNRRNDFSSIGNNSKGYSKYFGSNRTNPSPQQHSSSAQNRPNGGPRDNKKNKPTGQRRCGHKMAH